MPIVFGPKWLQIRIAPFPVSTGNPATSFDPLFETPPTPTLAQSRSKRSRKGHIFGKTQIWSENLPIFGWRSSKTTHWAPVALAQGIVTRFGRKTGFLRKKTGFGEKVGFCADFGGKEIESMGSWEKT